MKYIVYLLGLCWVAAGTMAILYTEDYKAYFRAIMERFERVHLALIPGIFGLLLLFAAPSTSHGWFITLIGALGIAKGLLIYFNPGSIVEWSSNWMAELSDQGYRLIGIIALVLGTVVISWVP